MVVCPGCNRYVRDETCPFCGASIVRVAASARPRSHGTRAALAFGTAAATAVGVTLAACSDSSTAYAPPYGAHPIGDATTGMDVVAAMPAYGGMGVPPDSSVTNDDASATEEAGADATDEASADAADQ
jgi:hypothetical protein